MQFYVFNLSNDKVSVNYSLSLGLLNSEHKRLVKKKTVDQAGQWPVNRRTFWIFPVG